MPSPAKKERVIVHKVSPNGSEIVIRTEGIGETRLVARRDIEGGVSLAVTAEDGTEEDVALHARASVRVGGVRFRRDRTRAVLLLIEMPATGSAIELRALGRR